MRYLVKTLPSGLERGVPTIDLKENLAKMEIATQVHGNGQEAVIR